MQEPEVAISDARDRGDRLRVGEVGIVQREAEVAPVAGEDEGGFCQVSSQQVLLPEPLQFIECRFSEGAAMHCPACSSRATSERSARTQLGYRRFRCRDCGRGFNERSGTMFNRLQYPTDIVCLVVLWRLRYKLSLRDLVEMFALRGFVFTHEAVREWEEKLAPHVSKELRKARRGKVGRSWYTDETYLRVAGRWCYLYRAIDRAGNLVDVRLSETRDRAAAEAFFASAQAVTGITPHRVTTDGHDAYPGAIKAKLGKKVTHRTSRYLNNHLEQDHRGIKGRYRPMRGFKSVASAHRFCRAYDEVRHFLRFPSPRNRRLSLDEQRWFHLRQVNRLLAIMEQAARSYRASGG